MVRRSCAKVVQNDATKKWDLSCYSRQIIYQVLIVVFDCFSLICSQERDRQRQLTIDIPLSTRVVKRWQNVWQGPRLLDI